jgi:hypothetical protein
MQGFSEKTGLVLSAHNATLGPELIWTEQAPRRPRTTTGLQAVIPEEAPLTILDLYEAIQKTRFEILVLREELESRTFLGRLRRFRVWLRQTFWRF